MEIIFIDLLQAKNSEFFYDTLVLEVTSDPIPAVFTDGGFWGNGYRGEVSRSWSRMGCKLGLSLGLGEFQSVFEKTSSNPFPPGTFVEPLALANLWRVGVLTA